MPYRLTVITRNKAEFNAYFYGYGYVTRQLTLDGGKIKSIIDYDDDYYRCNYQAGRFASGLIWSEVTEFVRDPTGWGDRVTEFGDTM